MAALPTRLFLLLLLVTYVVGSTESGKGLVARLDGRKDGLMECWSALLELKSCTNEIILFFLNGDTYLTTECCRAIRMITYDCWPSMLTSLGFTSDEADVLQGYCGAGLQPAAMIQVPNV